MPRSRSNNRIQGRTHSAKDFVRVDLPDGLHTYLPRTLGDSYGQFEAFRPAQHNKPGMRGFLERVTRTVQQWLKRPNPQQTSQIGAPGAASPTLYQMTLLQERYERRETLQEIWQMIKNEPRTRKATRLYAEEATRNGVKINLDRDKSSLSDAQFAEVEKIKAQIEKIVNPKCRGWAWALHVEGDLFIQAILKGNELVNAKRMPASAMERLTDDSDEFPDPFHAFAQLDVMTQENVTTFPLGIIHHERWAWVDGERYGESELLAGRRMQRLLLLTEEAQAVRRMTRATKRTHWKIGIPGEPSDPLSIEDFKANNGFLEGSREIFDSNEIARDFFTDPNVEMASDPADTGVSDVEDIKHTQNVYSSAVLPTPPVIYNLDSESVNRDVVEDVREEWNKSVQNLSNGLTNVVTFLMELALLLKGILPEAVNYEVAWSESTIERPAEIIDSVVKLRTVATPDFKPDPLISLHTAVSHIAHIFNIKDVEAEIKAIQKEIEERTERDFKQAMKQEEATQALQMKGQMQMQDAQGDTQPTRTNPVGKTGAQPPQRAQGDALQYVPLARNGHKDYADTSRT